MSNYLFQNFSDQEINVFLDESGKKKDRPNLMGALSIPKAIYNKDDIQYMNYFLKKELFKIHWKNFNGNTYVEENIKNLITVFSMYEEYIRLNVINYNYGFLKAHDLFSEDDINKTIYTKFPERLIYGLIRGYGSEMSLSADIFIDKANEYIGMNLEEVIIATLNTQSLYRGEKFYAKYCEMLPKNSEVGLELTDVLLGLIRTIIRNPTIQLSTSKIEREKVRLTAELLQNDALKKILKNMKYYEWRGNKELNKINFHDYIQAFLIKQLY
ncbi:DUF3800 domain-containing protein [Bacillus pretiosus]|uniref:DUF3800 domain-containing protein n=1 Tax=Bacillus pretiosus TaxID=2983392 RepID=UPI003D65B5A8